MSEGRARRGPAWWARWLHTYVSALGFFAVVGFGVTGLTLNHADWFERGGESVRRVEGQLDPAWLGPERDVLTDRLAVVEHLRASGARGAVTSFRIDADECVVVFKGAGYVADAVIDRATASFELTETRKGVVAVLDDLHKGRDTGPVWSVFIDVAAVVVTCAGLTGLWLLCHVRRRVGAGLVLVALGTAVPVVLWLVAVP